MRNWKQTLFSRVVRGLAKQGFKKSCRPEGTCVYRNAKGLKCAVGQLINDKHYRPAFDGAGIVAEILDAVRKSNPATLKGVADFDLDNFLFWNIQPLHDDSETVQERKADFRRFAKDNDLVMPAV